MPIYEYVCLNDKCSKIFDVLQKVNDPAPASCEYCGHEKLSKKMSLPSFHLKGGGWYKDGYGDKKTSSKSSSGSGTETSSFSTAGEKSAEVPKKETTDAPKEKPVKANTASTVNKSDSAA